MEKEFEDEELDKLINEQLISEQFIKEAKIMEEALFSDDDSEEYQASDEEIKASYQKLVERLKADGIYREDESDEEDLEDVEEEDEPDDLDAAEEIERPGVSDRKPASDVEKNGDKVVPISKKRRGIFGSRFSNVASFVLICGICIVVVSSRSEATRSYVVDSIKMLVGDDTRVVVDNDENNENINTDEYKALDDIEEKLDINVPEFMYRPEDFEIYNYEVDSYAQFARIEYKYNNTIVELGMDKVNETVASKFDSIDGDTLEIVNIKREDIDVVIRKIQDKQDESPTYLAQWKKDNIIFYIFGKIDLTELIKIIEEIRY